MSSLIKHHFFMIDALSYFMIAILIAGGYLVSIPPTFLFVITIISLPIILYYYFDKNKVNRFLISMPISVHMIMQSRYLFTIFMTLIVLLFQGLVMISASWLWSGSQYMYGWRDAIVLLCLASIMIAIIIPIYQLFQSFPLATSITAILFFFGWFFILSGTIQVMDMENNDIIIFNDLDPGLVLLVEKYIPYLPYPILIVGSGLFYYISCKVSVLLFPKKDY